MSIFQLHYKLLQQLIYLNFYIVVYAPSRYIVNNSTWRGNYPLVNFVFIYYFIWLFYVSCIINLKFQISWTLQFLEVRLYSFLKLVEIKVWVHRYFIKNFNSILYEGPLRVQKQYIKLLTTVWQVTVFISGVGPTSVFCKSSYTFKVKRRM